MSATIRHDDFHTTTQAFLRSYFPAGYTLQPIDGDAGSRQYFRIEASTPGYLLMVDPDTRQLQQYIHCLRTFQQHQAHVPTLYGYNVAHGLLLQSDFGDQLLAKAITQTPIVPLYQRCIDNLALLQRMPPDHWAPFDIPRLRGEVDLAAQWYVATHTQQHLSPAKQHRLDQLMQQLCQAVATVPQTVVHRDYHSRNLFILQEGVGMIDFQDAVYGPFLYDLVSLLRDYYHVLPDATVQQLCHYYFQHLNPVPGYTEGDLMRAFHTVALQRHYKCLGIFSRLHHRDKKPHYLSYLPTVQRYIHDATKHLPEYADLVEIMGL
jgi:aminoglycoside/choline kinase family phosphotransferase